MSRRKARAVRNGNGFAEGSVGKTNAKNSMKPKESNSACISPMPLLYAGQVVKLDEDMQNGSLVKVVQQTKGRLYAEVEDEDGNRWWVMSYRLTLPCV